MPGRVYTALLEQALDQGGYITTRDAGELDIEPHRLHRMASRGTLVQVSRGVFRFPDVPAGRLDQYIEAMLWPLETRGVLSNQTALDLHDLCDINPTRIHVTVPRSFRTSREPPALLVLHQEDLADEDLTWHEGLRIVTVYRAVLGSIHEAVGWNLIEQAISTAGERGRITKKQADELRQLRPGSAANE